MKLTDKAIFGMVSESPGRNASEPIGSLVRIEVPEAEPVVWGRRQHEMSHADWRGMSLRRGGRDSTVTRADRATGEAVLAPVRNGRSKVGSITGDTGK
jgi:hypothetical protein